jgi:hypothetical protein
MTWLIITIVGIIFVLLLVGIGWLWLRWKFRPLKYTSPLMTPEEVQGALDYAARQDALKAAEQAQRQPLVSNLQTDQERQAQIEQRREQRRLELEERRKEQEAIQEVQRQAEEQRQAAEQAAIARMPGWLLELAQWHNIPPTYDNLMALRSWLKYVLEFGQQELGGVFSVRTVYAALRNSKQPPLEHVTSYKFFLKMLRILTREGVLITDPATQAKKLTEQSIMQLGPLD